MKIHVIDLKFLGIERAVAVFLVEAPAGPILIETGPASTLEASLDGLRSLGFFPEDIRAVLVTHIHFDHAGAAGWWARQGATVYVHPAGARHLIDPSRLVSSARLIYGDEMERLWGDVLPVPAENLRPLDDLESVDIGAGKFLTAWDTPGHARHHHCYILDDAVFTGDVAGARLPGSKYVSVTAAPPQFDPEAYDRSLARLQDGGFSRLFLTHFGEVTDVDAHLADYRMGVQASAQFVRDRLAEGMDGDALQVAYKAFQMEIAFRSESPADLWPCYDTINSTAMCADGIRLYWQKKQTAPL
jgi:glyoxylase-like metal-dependent hydrolase (beta-lactamase superfamily II)